MIEFVLCIFQHSTTIDSNRLEQTLLEIIHQSFYCNCFLYSEQQHIDLQFIELPYQLQLQPQPQFSCYSLKHQIQKESRNSSDGNRQFDNDVVQRLLLLTWKSLPVIGEPPDHHREHLEPDFKCSETEENSREIVTCQLYACGLRHIHNGTQPQAPLHFIFFWQWSSRLYFSAIVAVKVGITTQTFINY